MLCLLALAIDDFVVTMIVSKSPMPMAGFDRVRFTFLAEALYRERLANFLDTWSVVEVREVADSRFDQAVVIDTGKNRCFIGRMGRAVLMERVRTDRDLMDHLDDFVAVLAEFQ